MFGGHANWFDVVHAALRNLGGAAHLDEIQAEVAKIVRELPRSWRAIVRHQLEIHSSDTDIFRGHRDVFHNVDGRGIGKWALRRQAEVGRETAA